MSDAFEAPKGDDKGIDDEFDPLAAVPHIVVRIAGAALVVAGAFVAVSGVQLWTFFELYRLWVKIAATLMILGGVAAFPIGGFYSMAKSWAVFLGLPLAGALALGSTLWLFYALWVTLFSPVMIFASGASLLAFVLILVGAPMALKAASARAALYR